MARRSSRHEGLPSGSAGSRPSAAFGHLDASTYLGRKLFAQGFYPAVDPLASSSRAIDPRIVGQEPHAVRVAANAAEPADQIDLARAEAALKRSLLRLEVAGKAGRI